MKSSLRLKLDQLSTRLVELNGLLGAEDVTRDLDRYRALTKEHSDLTPVVAKFREYQEAEGDLATAVDMGRSASAYGYARTLAPTGVRSECSLVSAR